MMKIAFCYVSCLNQILSDIEEDKNELIRNKECEIIDHLNSNEKGSVNYNDAEEEEFDRLLFIPTLTNSKLMSLHTIKYK